jgi:hypothetical protein
VARSQCDDADDGGNGQSTERATGCPTPTVFAPTRETNNEGDCAHCRRAAGLDSCRRSDFEATNEMLGTWCPTQDPLVEEKDGTITVKYERRQDCNPADDTSIVLGPRG